MRKNRLLLALAGALMVSTAATALAAAMNAQQKSVYDQYVSAAKTADPAFKEFNPKQGETFFREKHTGGKPETPVCTECHTTDLTKKGQTRAGKDIEPMAASVNPKRYTDPADVEKWFKRNCNDVVGRECTVTEKGNVLSYLLGL
jgi:hypothetical protein